MATRSTGFSEWDKLDKAVRHVLGDSTMSPADILTTIRGQDENLLPASYPNSFLSHFLLRHPETYKRVGQGLYKLA